MLFEIIVVVFFFIIAVLQFLSVGLLKNILEQTDYDKKEIENKKNIKKSSKKLDINANMEEDISNREALEHDIVSSYDAQSRLLKGKLG